MTVATAMSPPALAAGRARDVADTVPLVRENVRSVLLASPCVRLATSDRTA